MPRTFIHKKTSRTRHTHQQTRQGNRQRQPGTTRKKVRRPHANTRHVTQGRAGGLRARRKSARKQEPFKGAVWKPVSRLSSRQPHRMGPPYPCDLSKQTYETVVMPSQSLSVAHGGRQQPPKKPIASRRRGARDVDIIVHHATVNAPSPHVADAIEADTDGGSPARSALAKGVPRPSVSRRRRHTKARQNQL